MFEEESLNRELEDLIKYIKIKSILNQLHHESIITIVDNFYREDEKNGNIK